MTTTVISLDTSMDVISKYKQLVEASANGESLYVRAREVIKALKEDNLITNGDEGTAIAQVVAQLSGSASSQAMSTALAWESAEKELVLKKEELEKKIDLLKIEATKAEYDADLAKLTKNAAEAKMIREYGANIVYVNGSVATLPDEGRAYEEIKSMKQATLNAEATNYGIKAQTGQAYASIHKLVADTYVNHGMYSGYTVAENGITGTQKLSTGYVTLSEMNRVVAGEQAKGYVLNAYSNAASSSAGMIGTLVAAEIPGLDPTQYLQTWKSAVDKLNNLVVPTITPSSISF